MIGQMISPLLVRGSNLENFFQEVAAGQYLGSGGLTMIGQLVPMMQGVGYATMTIVFWLGMTAASSDFNNRFSIFTANC
jgi:hypothetical protein